MLFMGKSVQYKLNKTKKNTPKSRGKKTKVSFPFLKYLKILILFVLIFILGYWFYIAYRTVAEVKVQDVVGDSEVVTFSAESKVQKTLIVYQDPNATEEKNLFILAVIYNEDTSEALLYYFPSNLYLSDYFTDQYISVENLTYAGNSYMHKDKQAYVIRQIEEQMAVKFDSYIWFGSEISRNFISDDSMWGYKKDDVLTMFSKLSFVNLIPRYYKVNLFYDHLHSNKNFLEMYTLFQNVQGVLAAGNYQYVDLKDETMLTNVVLGNGAKVHSLNLSAMDKSLRSNIDILRTKDLSREHVKVEVYNGSDVPMQARVMARKIHNAGCNVIRHENAAQTYEENYIYIPNKEKFPNGLEIVSSVVGDAVIVDGRPEFMTTGDIIVVLGGEQ